MYHRNSNSTKTSKFFIPHLCWNVSTANEYRDFVTEDKQRRLKDILMSVLKMYQHYVIAKTLAMTSCLCTLQHFVVCIIEGRILSSFPLNLSRK